MKKVLVDICNSLLWVREVGKMNGYKIFLGLLISLLGAYGCNLVMQYFPKGIATIFPAFVISDLLVSVLVFINKSVKSKYLTWSISFVVGIFVYFLVNFINWLRIHWMISIYSLTGGNRSDEWYMAMVCVLPILVIGLAVKVVIDFRKRKKK